LAGAASWSFNENDFKQIQTHLQAFLRDSNARCALLVDPTASSSRLSAKRRSSIPPPSRHSPPRTSAPTISWRK